MTTDSDSLQAATKQDLIREVRKLRQEVQELRAELDRQQTELEELRGDLQQERRDRKQAEEELKKQRTQQIARAKADVREDVQELHDTVVTEQQTRSRADARLKQRVNELADAADVEISDEDLAAKDTLVRLVRNGPSDITDRVYPVHERARALLQHPDEWGSVFSDANGTRVVYTAPEVRPYLNAYFDRQFKTSEIKRVFEKIEGLAETSPRTVRKDKNRDGEHLLVVQLVEGGLTATD